MIKLKVLIIIICTLIASDTLAVNFIDQNTLPTKILIERRRKLISNFSEKTLLIIPSFHFYQTMFDIYNNSKITPNLYYLTNLPPHKSVLILSKTQQLIFLKYYTNNQKRWIGETLDSSLAKVISGIEQILNLDEINHWITENVANYDTIYIDNIHYRNHFSTVDKNEPCEIELINQIKETNPKIVILKDIPYIDEMRKIKDNYEIDFIKKAVNISSKAHLETIKQIKPGLTESQIQAIMEYNFRFNGSERPAYNSIVATASNACYLHYNKNTDTLKSGDLILMDCGASYKGYASDLTRTVPVNGKFTTEQKIIYQIVLEAQDSAIAKCKPGNHFYDIHKAAKRVIETRLKESGILNYEDDVSSYFPHGTSHFIGLNVHDTGKRDTLKSGMVLTAEPGIYIPTNSNCDSIWWNIGVRIEDDILITDNEPVILSRQLPKLIREIEDIMTKRQSFQRK